MIIGYFHVCQKGEWRKSFDMIFSKIKESGLYDQTHEIRCGVINDSSTLENDIILNDPKIKIIYIGHSAEYERPTLLHMQKSSYDDDKDTKYWYVHTKGLKWFNTQQESFIIDWINLMIYWNLENWKLALESLKTHDTYGCNYIGDARSCSKNHYSGNFWWATSKYIQTLPSNIGQGYTDPEFWIGTKKPIACNIFSSGLQGMGHYYNPYPRNNYYKK